MGILFPLVLFYYYFANMSVFWLLLGLYVCYCFFGAKEGQ